MKIIETCSCGASIQIGDGWNGSVIGTVEDWRISHRHEVTREPEPAPEQRGVSTSDFTFGFTPDHPRPAEVQQ